MKPARARTKKAPTPAHKVKRLTAPKKTEEATDSKVTLEGLMNGASDDEDGDFNLPNSKSSTRFQPKLPSSSSSSSSSSTTTAATAASKKTAGKSPAVLDDIASRVGNQKKGEKKEAGDADELPPEKKRKLAEIEKSIATRKKEIEKKECECKLAGLNDETDNQRDFEEQLKMLHVQLQRAEASKLALLASTNSNSTSSSSTTTAATTTTAPATTTLAAAATSTKDAMIIIPDDDDDKAKAPVAAAPKKKVVEKKKNEEESESSSSSSSSSDSDTDGEEDNDDAPTKNKSKKAVTKKKKATKKKGRKDSKRKRVKGDEKAGECPDPNPNEERRSDARLGDWKPGQTLYPKDEHKKRTVAVRADGTFSDGEDSDDDDDKKIVVVKAKAPVEPGLFVMHAYRGVVGDLSLLHLLLPLQSLSSSLLLVPSPLTSFR